GGADVLNLRVERHVLGHRQPGEQRVLLEHHAAMRIDVAHLAPVDDDAPGAGPLEAGNQVEQRRLAAARCAQHHQELAARNLQIDAVQRLEGSEGLGNALDGDHGVIHRDHASTLFSMTRNTTSVTSTVTLISAMPSTTVSVWKNSLPFMMRKPRPSLAATSSAEITQVHDRPRITLKPLKICGRLAGRITERMTCELLA